ncbi:ABC-2 family transporter protein [Paenibacillus algorifonticola]|uniref:ABC-2 family transporter protein n=1 Tax=Paenibacillus algorifonticola TaxID=684063 RepID=A0A1I2A908_9BACL|nr:ABC-2 family transporter protein [Paenibacillus algorifonticola]
MAGVVWAMLQQGWAEEDIVIYPTYVAVLRFIRVMVNITFAIFAAVLMARIIIGEYANKTISLLSVYPIDRSKLLLSKLTLISLVTLAVLVVSNLFISVVLMDKARLA